MPNSSDTPESPTATVRVGQKWREKDKRFPNAPSREVMGFAGDGKVLLAAAYGSRPAKCDPKRFNGKNGGYELVEDCM